MSNAIPGITNPAMLAQFDACRSVLPASAYQAVTKKIVGLLSKNAEPAEKQAHHTRREMLVGAYLASQSLEVAYDRRFGGQTPDWTILEDSTPRAIVEVFTLNADRKTAAILAQGATKVGPTVVWMDEPDVRIERAVQGKVDAYRDLANTEGVALIAAICPSLEAGITHEVPGSVAAILAQEPSLSGVLHMEHLGAGYRFTYIPNPTAPVAYSLPAAVWNKAHPG